MNWTYMVPRTGKPRPKRKPKKKGRKFPPGKSVRTVSGGLPSLGKKR